MVREAAYTQTSQALAKWDPVVQQNRNAEQLVFPLQQDCVTVAPIEDVISNWKVGPDLAGQLKTESGPDLVAVSAVFSCGF